VVGVGPRFWVTDWAMDVMFEARYCHICILVRKIYSEFVNKLRDCGGAVGKPEFSQSGMDQSGAVVVDGVIPWWVG